MPARRSVSRSSSGTPRWRQLANRAAVAAGVCGLLWFAVEGGEFGTREMFAQHAKREALEAEVAQLKADVDSLNREKQAVLKNDAVLERIAREQYGMLKGSKELLFWTNNASASKDSAPPHDAAPRDTMSGHQPRGAGY